jgi:ATP-dependent DNA ligase
MVLPVEPPIAPMLARLAQELPDGDYAYEPKWDGFRCLAFRDGDAVDLRSRHDRPLARYFPEVVDALLALPQRGFVLDGEIVPTGSTPAGFADLMRRLHPAASRVARLRDELPASYVAFDLLAIGDRSLLDEPFAVRRAALERLLAAPSDGLSLTPATRDHEVAVGWLQTMTGAGVDGIVAKALDAPYAPGRRTMTKVKRERTADCVVAGARLVADGSGVSSLLLALYADDGELRHVGVVAAFPAAERRSLLALLARHAIPLEMHPWREGFAIGASPLGRLKGSASRWTPDMAHDWLPVAPVLVAEVAFDQVDIDRFRHPARFRRWRPDRDPRSCTLDQLDLPPATMGRLLERGARAPAA